MTERTRHHSRHCPLPLGRRARDYARITGICHSDLACPRRRFLRSFRNVCGCRQLPPMADGKRWKPRSVARPETGVTAGGKSRRGQMEVTAVGRPSGNGGNGRCQESPMANGGNGGRSTRSETGDTAGPMANGGNGAQAWASRRQTGCKADGRPESGRTADRAPLANGCNGGCRGVPHSALPAYHVLPPVVQATPQFSWLGLRLPQIYSRLALYGPMSRSRLGGNTVVARRSSVFAPSFHRP